MTNNIGITWTSDQRQLIRDMQERASKMDEEIQRLKKLLAAGTAAGAGLARGGKMAGDAYRQAGVEMDRLGRIAATSFQKSASPMEAHLKRMKEYRVLMRMGKIDAEQLAKANQASLKQYYDESGMTDRLRRSKAEKAQRLKDFADEIADRRKQADQIRQVSKNQYERAYDDYQAFMVKLRALRHSGKINPDDFRKAWGAAKERFQDQSGLTAQMKEGKRLLEQYSSAWEKHNVKVAKYRELLKAGAIDQKTFNKAVADSNPALQGMAENTEKSSNGLGRMAGKITALIGGYVSLRGAVSALISANREAQAQAEAAISKQEDLLIRYRAQGGLDKLRGDEAKKAIYKAALTTATTAEDAFGAAQAMVSTGFDPKAVEDGSLTEFLKLLKAQALHPNKAVSPQEMAESVSQFMTANNLSKSPENMSAMAVAVQGLKATPLKMSDLPQLSEHSGTLKELGGLDWKDQLAVFSHLRGTETAEMAGTHLREIVRQLATEGGSAKSTGQLAKMGMRPEDVDFIGEDFFEVMRRLKAGLERLPEEERKVAADTLVEGRNISSLFRVMNSEDEIKALKGQMGDRKGFDADFEMTSTGKNAASIRLDTAIEMKQSSRDIDSKNDRKRFVLETENMTPIKKAMVRGVYDFMDFTAGHEDHMMALGDATASNRMARKVVDRDIESAKVDKWIREQIRSQPQNAPAAPPPINVNVQVNMPGAGEKPAPVPAAALGGG